MTFRGSVDYDEGIADCYRSDPALAVEMLNDLLHDDESNDRELLSLLRQVMIASGHDVQILTPLTGAALTLQDFTAILNLIGLRLTVEPAPQHLPPHEH